MIVIDKTRVRSNTINRDYIPVKLLKCPARNCRYRFELDVIQQIMQKREFNLSLNHALRTAGISLEAEEKQKKVKIENFSCLICCSELSEKDGILLECNDTFCKTCMKRFLEEEYIAGKGIHGLMCPLPGCKTSFDVCLIKELLGQDKIVVLEERAIRQKYKVFDCPNCGAVFIIPKDYRSRELCCVTCGETLCRLCNQKYHSGLCQYRSQVTFTLTFSSLTICYEVD
jgi:hypothetical protein